MSIKTLLAGLGLAAIGMGAVTADAAAVPFAYSQREWIQSTGNQYIKIDYWHTATTRVELACHIPTPTSGSYPVMFGSRDANASSCAYYFAGRWASSNRSMFCLTGSETYGSTDYFYDQDITVYTDGATKVATWTNDLGQASSFTCGGTAGSGKCSWTLFWLNKATSKDGVVLDAVGSVYKFYSMKIYEGETLVCDLVPVVRRSDEVAGVYDLQRDCFFANGKPENPFKVGDPTSGVLVAALTLPDDTTVDGIHPLQGASVSVTDGKTGETLVEGTDYTVAWVGDLAAPGDHVAVVTGKPGTVYEGFVERLPFELPLATDARRPYLPAGYTEVEWVSSTLSGNQWVNTGVVHTPTTEVTCICFAESKLNGMKFGSLFGSRNDSFRNNCYCYFVRFDGASCYSRTGNEKTGSTFLFDKLVTVSALNAIATVTDGTTTNTITTTGTLDEGKSPFLLFCHNIAGSATGVSASDYCVAKIYSFVMCEGDVKACWLVPCYRNSDGAVGFYDVTHLCEGDGGFRPNGAATALTKGVDIIRPAKADETLDFFRTGGEATFVDFIYSVNDAALVGAAATLEWADNAEFTDASQRDLGASAAYLEEVSGRIEGLRAGKTYYLRLTLRKDGRADVVRSFSFETPSAAGVISEDVDIAWVGGKPVFNGSILIYGAGDTHTVKLYFSTDGETFEEAGSVEVAGVGAFSITGIWPAYFQPVRYKLVYVTDDGESETPIRDQTVTCTATYTWKGAVAEGNWTDAENWTVSNASVVNPPDAYPCRDSYHIVTFPESKTNVIHLAGGESFWYADVGKNACVTLKGDGATPVALNGGAFRVGASGFSLILDNVAFVQSNSGGATQSGTDNMGANSGIRLQNGSSFMKDGGGWPVNFVSSGDRLELVGGSTLTFVNNANYFRFYSPDSVVLIDDSVFSCNVPIHLNDAASDWTTWRFAGEGPLLEAKGGCSVQGTGGVKLVFDAPKGGFAAAPLKVTGGMLATCNGPVEISVPDKAQVWKGSICTFPLIDAPSGINTNNVTFSTGRRTNGTFIWTTTEGVTNPTGLKFKARVNGMLLLVR